MARPLGRAGRWACALIVGLMMAPAARAEVTEAAHRVGADAAIFLEMARPDLLVDRLSDASLQKMLGAIPGYSKAFESDGFKTFRTVVGILEDKLGTTWEQGLRTLTGGGIVLAVEGEPGKPPRVTLIVTPTDPDFLRRANDALLELARQDAAVKGHPNPVKSRVYRGITAYDLDGAAYAVVAGTLVIVNSPDALKAVIDRTLDGIKPGTSIADDPVWNAERSRVAPETLAWGFARLDRLRALDPKAYTLNEKANPPLTILFGSWLDALRKAPWASASLTWTEDRLGAELTVPSSSADRPASLKGYLPPKGAGAPGLLNPPGTIASLGLWRDLSAIWEARAELFSPEVVQGLTQLDTFAGTFFGGREFGSGVLGALGSDWRLVIAHQDYPELRPSPDVKLPAFALIVDLKPDDEEFAQRLKIAFQSFVGLANLDTAKSKAPPLELGSEVVDGVTIATARYMTPRASSTEKAAVHQRHNFSPSTAQVGNQFILSSSVALTRDLIRALKSPAPPNDATLVVEADGPALARLLDLNRARVVMQNMLEKGHDKAKAEAEVDTVVQLLRYLGHARLSIRDGAGAVQLGLHFAIAR